MVDYRKGIPKSEIPQDPPSLGIAPLIPHPCEVNRKQDLPPAGGYPKIPWKHNPARKFLNGYFFFGGYIGMTAISLYLYYLNYQTIKRHEIEMMSHKMAIYPILLAERDREYLKQLRKNRDEETVLMKDVPGWEVGQWYKERVYVLKNSEEDLVDPIFHEYFAHCDPRLWFKRAYHALRS